MGIHNLIRYISKYNKNSFSQVESGNNLYISSIMYIDLTSKLIEIYKKFNEHPASNINQLITFSTNMLRDYIMRIKKFNTRIYAFVDYKFINDLAPHNILFKDFLFCNVLNERDTCDVNVNNECVTLYANNDVHGDVHNICKNSVNNQPNMSHTEMLKCAVLTPRECITSIDNIFSQCKLEQRMPTEDEETYMLTLVNKTRNLYELKSIYNISSNTDTIHNYINIQCLINRIHASHHKGSSCSQTRYDELTAHKLRIYNIILEEGRYRYLLHRGAKLNVKQHRLKSSFMKIFNIHNDSQCSDNVNKLIYQNPESSKRYLNTYSSYIPFTFMLFMFPTIIKSITSNDILFLGCEVESDFAITSHINTYSKNAFPTIITSDTDLVVLLSDVNCLIKLTMTKGETYNVNPIYFWANMSTSLFKSNCISKRVIKIISVLLGTDYNPYAQESPIHFSSFEEMMNKFDMQTITEEKLLTYVYMALNANVNNNFCIQTAIALNIYLNEIESNQHVISAAETNECYMNRFMQISKMNCLYIH